MTEPPTESPEAHDQLVMAIRFTMETLDMLGRGETVSTFGMELDEVGALASGMAILVIRARCALAEREGITGTAEQHECARTMLESELQMHTFAALEAGLGEPGA